MNENAIDVIKNNLDVETILDYYKTEGITHNGNYIRACCPLHRGDNPTSFVVNVDNGLFACHTGDCGAGDMITFVEKMEGYNFVEAVKKLASILGIDIDNMIIAERKSTYQKELQEWLKFIKRKKTKREIHEFTIKEEVLPLKKYRTFTTETLTHFKAGYAKTVNYKNSNGEERFTLERIVCPIYEKGIQVGASLRKTKQMEKVKWLHLPTGLDIGSIIYNLEACKEYDTIIICEGIFDVWAYHQAGMPNAVCVFGSKIKEEQVRAILRTGKDVVFSFDGDEAGLKATKDAIESFKYKARISIVHFEEGCDPGNVTSEELIRLYEQREKYYV